ncbi:hypothetical protein QW131_17630 [Roseibium salinum]|nr:hypothetical protein [Roseibium salinum]
MNVNGLEKFLAKVDRQRVVTGCAGNGDIFDFLDGALIDEISGALVKKIFTA